MNGIYTTGLRAFGAEELLGAGSFETAGGAQPTVKNQARGLPFSVVYSGTGIYTISFDPQRFILPKKAYLVRAHLDGPIADYAAVSVTANELHLPACRLVLQLHRAGVAQAPGTGSVVGFAFVGTNNVGG